jgi:2-polyprenyl-6-methoxyphenol hydroxylase-like FAD-dependent oxidoreductase
MILDTILVEAAARAGAEVRPAFTVNELLSDGGLVSGIRGHARGGATLTERARLVVGADGRHSLVARAVAAPAYRARSTLTCAGTVPIPEFFAPGNIQRIIDTSRKPAAHGHQAAGSSISPSPPATGAVPPPGAFEGSCRSPMPA